VCVFVALGIQHAVRMYHVVICGLPRSTLFFHLIQQKAPFSKKLLNTKCILISLKFYLKHLSFQEELSKLLS